MKKTILGIWLLLLGSFGILIDADPVHAQFSDSHHLLNAIENNDISVARERLSNGANPNATRDGNPGIVIAAMGRSYEIMKLLLESGARVNDRTEVNDVTALMVVAARGDETAFHLLIEYKADVDLADRQGRTALMKAAGARKANMVRLLIENGADIYANDYTGRDALQFAEEGRARSVAKILKEAMADQAG